MTAIFSPQTPLAPKPTTPKEHGAAKPDSHHHHPIGFLRKSLFHHHPKLLREDSAGDGTNTGRSREHHVLHKRRRSTANFFFSIDLDNISETIQGKFSGQQNASEQGSEDGSAAAPLITKLDKYTHEELREYRQVFNMFDADRSGAIGLDELENAISSGWHWQIALLLTH